MKILLKGCPLSNNSIYQTMCRGNFPSRYLSNKGKSLKEDYQWQILQQYKDKPMLGEIKVDIKLFHKSKRKTDWDNFHKLSMDSMTGLVYEDDSQVKKATVEKFIDKDNPRIEIEIL